MILVLLKIIVIGVALWLVNKKIPMDSTLKTILNVIVVLGACLWLLFVFGIIDASSIPVLHRGR